MRLGEYTPVETVSRIARGIDAHGPDVAAELQIPGEALDVDLDVRSQRLRHCLVEQLIEFEVAEQMVGVLLDAGPLPEVCTLEA